MIGFEYGNTRLRAMRSRLLRSEHYAELMAAGSIDRMLGALHDTPYRSDVEAAIARFTGLRRLDEAVRTNLGRTLRAVRMFYGDEPGRRVELLMRRWDLRNVRSILRAAARPASTDEILPHLVSAGTLSDAELGELASRGTVQSLVDLMVAWGVPTPQTARRVSAALPDYEATGDLALLEGAVHRAWMDSVADRLMDAEPGDVLTTVVYMETDETNLLTVLRLSTGQTGAETDAARLADHLIPGARIPPDSLEAVAYAASRDEAASVLIAAALPARWPEAIRAWSETGDLVALAGRLDEAITRFAMSRFAAGDPLGIDIPVAFTFAKEAESRNLRLVGRGIVHRLPPDVISARLTEAA